MAYGTNELSQQKGKTSKQSATMIVQIHICQLGVVIYTTILTVQLPNLVVPDYYSDRNNSY